MKIRIPDENFIKRILNTVVKNIFSKKTKIAKGNRAENSNFADGEEADALRNIEFVLSNRAFVSYEKMSSDEIFEKIRKGLDCRGVRLIMMSEQVGEMFEIYTADELLLPFYEGKRFVVCGIAKGRKRTYRLLVSMIDSMYQEMGRIDANLFFNS